MISALTNPDMPPLMSPESQQGVMPTMMNRQKVAMALNMARGMQKSHPMTDTAYGLLGLWNANRQPGV